MPPAEPPRELGQAIRQLRRLRHPGRQAAAATRLLDQLLLLQREVSALRDAAVRRMRDDGASYGDIALASGLTRSRIVQLLQRTQSVPHQRPGPAHGSGTDIVGSGTGRAGSAGSRPVEPEVVEDGDGPGEAPGPGRGAADG